MANNPLNPIEIVQLVEARFNDLQETSNNGSTIDASSLRKEVMLILMDVFGKENFDENGKFTGSLGSSSIIPQEIKEVLYKLDNPVDGGLTINDLTKAKQILKDLKPTHVFTGKVGQPHPQSGYGIWTADIVNEFLNASDLKISNLNPDGTPVLDKKSSS